MSWELTRRRLTRAVNSKFIYDRVPLLHAIIFLTEMAIIARLVSRFNSYYDQRPVLTMMVTNAVLGGVADTVAQTITSVRQRAVRKPGGPGKNDTFAIEIHELDRKNPMSDHDLVPNSKALPPPFDFERLTRFAAYGFCMAPLQFKWFSFLSRAFPVSKDSALGPAMKRVIFDQLVFAPFGLAVFFTVMTVAEGGGKRAVTNKLRDMYVPTLKANYLVWPAVQIINFRLMPVQFQLPFVSTVGIAWTAYLSLTNSSEEADQKVHEPNSNIRLQ
ncbi:vacuolar membrane protein [Microdochium trichocladiopsis]|uniref:Vacuolar membrane protein n=1 Tax=Microdochium trichocladiopsis TaxID=1682393 RepID=A0A9P8YGV3_9PEZI|nr:vacuolar membrane protein [Microdochium trichocladiopsis]KAH7039693.1 vacuolar membrane protein [Microdochium trichocladiopsis]